ncbi:SGL-domain-containing protein, partial [Martensiomyces pterosporus]
KPYLTANTTKFGAFIEGAGVDRQGNFYAVDFNDNKAATGRAYSSQAVLFADKVKTNSWFNAIRFNIDRNGVQEAYLGDVTNHRVVRLRDPGNKGQFFHSETFCEDANILQPNDLAIAHTTGRLFLSGMRFTPDSVIGDGDMWTCDQKGVATKLGSFYRTNGIEVSPDEKLLYLSEAINKGGKVVSNVIHVFDLDAEKGTVSNKRLFVDFGKLDNSASNDVDGMRTDVQGNLYVARWGAGKVAKISPGGELLAYIELASIAEVTNLEFAGPNGKDLYIVGACKDKPTKGCIDRLVGNSKQGRAFANLQ